MLEELPHTAWVQLMLYLGFYEMCFIRNVSKNVKKRVDDTILQVYNKIQGTTDTFMADTLEAKLVFPKINLNMFNDRKIYYDQIKKIIKDYQYEKLKKIIVEKNFFESSVHKVIINNIDFVKLKKAITLVILGLSNHYIIKTMYLDIKKINNAIKLKTKDICDLFCYRGCDEFNDYQVNNFIRLKEHTYQDCFTFIGAMRLNNSQVDKVIEYKKDGLLDFYALEKAGCTNLFSFTN
jgi:hypothetical protein